MVPFEKGTRSTTECDPETYHQDALHSCPKTAVVDFLSCNNTLHTLLSQVVPSLWCRDIALETVTSSCTDHNASPIAEVACIPVATRNFGEWHCLPHLSAWPDFQRSRPG